MLDHLDILRVPDSNIVPSYIMESVTVPTPAYIANAWWNEVCKKLKNAIVFIDNIASECLHWNGGLTRLIQAGAKNVKEFSSFEKGFNDDQKAVFLISSVIKDTTRDILCDIVKASKFQYCVVISSVHPHVYAYARHPGREVDPNRLLGQLEQDILCWMTNMNYTVEMLYYPLTIVPVMDGLFLMPGFSDLYPLTEADVAKIAKLQQEFNQTDKTKPVESLAETEFCHLPLKLRIMIRQFVVNLNSLLQGMNVKDEIFTLGHTSRIIGTDLESYAPARQRRKTAGRKVSVVLVDRSLDLVAPTSHSEDTLMDRILSLLPRLPGQNIDSAVNMSPLCQVHSSCEWTLLPGCMSHPSDTSSDQIMPELLSSNKKTTLNLINNKVVDAAKKLKCSDQQVFKQTDSKSPESLKQNVKLFASDSEIFSENLGLLQSTLGVVEALTHPRYSHLDQLLSIEKLYLQALCDPDDTPPFTQIMQLLRTRNTRGVSVDDILTLLVHLTSLAGPNSLPTKLHYSLTNSLSQAILEDKHILSDAVLSLVGEEVDEVSALKTSQYITEQLQVVAAARQHLTTYRELYHPGDSVEPATVSGLIDWLVKDCLTRPHSDNTDLEYKSAGLKDFIKTGFSLFVNVSKPVPRDAVVMIVVVVGGITCGEIKKVREIVEELQPECNVILASSHLTYPSDIITKALSSNNLLFQI